MYIYCNYVFAVSQSWTHWTHSAHSNTLHQHKTLGSALWRLSLMEQFKQRLIGSWTVLILEICNILVFVFPFYSGGTYDKDITTFRFLVLVLVLVLHLNVLAKHNIWNLWQVNTSLIVSFISAYFEESGLSNTYQGTERCSETDRQTARISHQCIILHIL
jgi:hypothetical protein